MSFILKWVFMGVCLSFFPRIGFAINDYSTRKIITYTQTGNTDEIFDIFAEIEADLQQTSFADCKKFLQSLIEEMNLQYGMSLTTKDACQLIKENLHLTQIPRELQASLLSVIELIGSETMLVSENEFSHKANTNVFGYGLYWPWEWNWFGLNKKHHSSQNSLPMHHRNIELELPPKMAAGFMCALGGALLCIIPGGQGVGLTLIGTGLGLALDGMANGERPYYVDSTH